MTLFSPPVVQALNEYCIPFHVNVDNPDPDLRAANDELRAWVAEHYPELSPLFLSTADIGPYLVSPEGEVLSRVPGVAFLLDEILAVAKEQGLEPRPAVVGERFQKLPPRLAPEDLLVRVTARFLDPKTVPPEVEIRLPQPPAWSLPLSQKRLSPEYVEVMFRERLRSPTQDWVVLKPAAQAALLPPAGRTSWDVPQEVATELLWLFRPSTHQFRIKRGDVIEARLQARLAPEAGTDQGTRAALKGRVKVRQYWFPTSGEGLWLGDMLVNDYHAEADVSGYMDFEGERITSLRLATEDGLYRGVDDTQVPYAAILYSVRDPDEALPVPDALCPLPGR